MGYTLQGLKPRLRPLFAVLAEVRLVAQLWLRPGHTSCGGNVTTIFPDLWETLPRHLRLRGVRADAGFCRPELLALWEQLHLPYVVVATLSQPLQKIIKGDLTWAPTEVPGTEVAELEYLATSWPHPRRLVLIRQRVREDQTRGGKRLLDVPGYRFQALVTSLPSASHPPLAVWRYYNERADCENAIKELREGFALPALSLTALTYNLTGLFQRHFGWQKKITIHSLRFWPFVTAGVLSHPAGQTTVKLAVPPRERG